MRIIYVIERLSGTGGLQRILTDKMNFLAENTAHEIVLMTVWQDDRALPYKLSPNVRRIRLNVPPTLLALPIALWRFNKYIKRANPDITVFFRAVGAFLTALTTWKGKKVFEAHLDYNHSNHNWLYPIFSYPPEPPGHASGSLRLSDKDPALLRLSWGACRHYL